MPKDSPQDVRVLSLDGGGSWAWLQARALKELYGGDIDGHELLGKFDMVSASSGGSLVLAGLLLNWKIGEVLRVFEEEDLREKIFVRNFGPDWCNRYKASAKKLGLKEILRGDNGFTVDGTAPLATLVAKMHERQSAGRHTEVAIAGFDFDREKAVFFKSCDGSGISNSTAGQCPRRKGAKFDLCATSLVEACHVSSNAPVLYFDDPAEVKVDDKDFRGWDGAMGGYNNPVVAGIAEALAVYKCDPEQVKCLSIGTANTRQPIWGIDEGEGDKRLFQKISGTSALSEATKGAKAILAEPPSSANYVAMLLLGHRPPFSTDAMRLVRMNPMIQPKHDVINKRYSLPGWARDEYSRYVQMAELEMDAVEQSQVKLIMDFGESWIQGDADNQKNAAGEDAAFSAVKARWLKIAP